MADLGFLDMELRQIHDAEQGDERAWRGVFQDLAAAVSTNSLTERQREWLQFMLLRIADKRDPIPQKPGRFASRYYKRNDWIGEEVSALRRSNPAYSVAEACRVLAVRVNAAIHNGDQEMAQRFHTKRRETNSKYITGKTLENVYAQLVAAWRGGWHPE